MFFLSWASKKANHKKYQEKASIAGIGVGVEVDRIHDAIAELTVGRAHPGGGGFSGTLDEIRIHDRPLSPEEITENHGFEEKTVLWVQRQVDLNEWKRHQAAPGLRVTSKAFGIGRRIPIVQRFGR